MLPTKGAYIRVQSISRYPGRIPEKKPSFRIRGQLISFLSDSFVLLYGRQGATYILALTATFLGAKMARLLS